jgi:hypothetical protein
VLHYQGAHTFLLAGIMRQLSLCSQQQLEAVDFIDHAEFIATAAFAVLLLQLGAHLLRLHVVLNTPDGEAAVGNRQAELAAMTGKDREQGQASNMVSLIILSRV